MKEPIGWLLVAFSLTVLAKVATDRPQSGDSRHGITSTAGLVDGRGERPTELDDFCSVGHGEPSGANAVIAADRKSNRLRVYRSTGELLQEIRIARTDDTDRSSSNELVRVD